MDEDWYPEGWNYVAERPMKPYVVTVSEAGFVASHILDVDLTDCAVFKEYDTLDAAEELVRLMSKRPNTCSGLFLR
jgi:hypothetical protein